MDRRDDEAFWSAAHDAVARLRSDPVAWRDYLAELDAWDVVAGDALGAAHREWPEYQQAEPA